MDEQQLLKQLRYDLDSAIERAEYTVKFCKREAQKYRGMKGFEAIVAHTQYEADRLHGTVLIIKENLKRLDDYEWEL